MATQGPPNDTLAHAHQVPIGSAVEVTRRPPDPRVDVEGAVPLWIAIRNRQNKYAAYEEFVRRAFATNKGIKVPSSPLVGTLKGLIGRTAGGPGAEDHCLSGVGHGLHAYQLLKTATEIFLLLECGVFIAEYGNGIIPGAERESIRGTWNQATLQTELEKYMPGNQLPYLKQVLGANLESLENDSIFEAMVLARTTCPCFIELIWSYWHEEGMLVQALNTLSLRFQNRRGPGDRDPLANLELSPLRPLSQIFWGYIQDEQQRLSMMRRNYEYEHEYGIALRGKAVPATMRPADRRSKFIEAFHDLLFRCCDFYRQASDMNYVPDPFPLLNGLKEVHLILSQGAGNQFGDLPWTARVEMLMQQWILGRNEIKEFLGRRPMVAYPEAWMGNAETLKVLMGWSDTPTVHFGNLATMGEKLLLSIRWTDWQNRTSVDAQNWAQYFKPEIQGYTHAYRVATGVDLTIEPKDSRASAERKENPAVLLERRLNEQQRNGGV